MGWCSVESGLGRPVRHRACEIDFTAAQFRGRRSGAVPKASGSQLLLPDCRPLGARTESWRTVGCHEQLVSLHTAPSSPTCMSAMEDRALDLVRERTEVGNSTDASRAKGGAAQFQRETPQHLKITPASFLRGPNSLLNSATCCPRAAEGRSRVRRRAFVVVGHAAPLYGGRHVSGCAGNCVRLAQAAAGSVEPPVPPGTGIPW